MTALAAKLQDSGGLIDKHTRRRGTGEEPPASIYDASFAQSCSSRSFRHPKDGRNTLLRQLLRVLWGKDSFS